MPNNFRNPYHFIPTPDPKTVLSPKQLKDKDSQHSELTHERYVPRTLSGELQCRITLKTPTVIGGQQTRPPGDYAFVQPVTRVIKNAQVPIIPASSLRGMVGAIAEAISCSSLRVLANTAFSYHKSMREQVALSALGMVFHEGEGKFSLVPLTMPTIKWDVNSNWYRLPPNFQSLFPVPALRIYFSNRTDIRDASFTFRSASDKRDQWFMEYPRLTWDPGNPFCLPANTPGLHQKPGGPNSKYLLGYKSKSLSPHRPGQVGDSLGFIRVLGCWGDRVADIPPTKQHELFLPLPRGNPPKIPIPPHVVNRFNELADERYQESIQARKRDPSKPFLPFFPRKMGIPDQRIPPGLHDGDIVYFDVDAHQQITEIAFSALWRHRPEDGNHKAVGAHQFFASASQRKDLLPYSAARTKLTPAELLLGFVADDKHDHLPAFASRIQFTDAFPDPAQASQFANPFYPEVPLKILASPKPPSPAIYFCPTANGARVAKHELKPGVSKPQGRKTYLHHHVPPGRRPWQTQDQNDRPEQKNMVTPLRENLQFVFSVRFYNLTKAELGMLTAAIAPQADFHHKIGMGKPLGLGSVKLEILDYQEVSRTPRYSFTGLTAARSSAADWSLRRDDYWKSVNADVKRALELLGRLPTPTDPPVQVPTVEHITGINAHNTEQRTFLWFVANDNGVKHPDNHNWEIRAQKESLTPLNASSKILPTLEQYEWD